MSAEVTSQNPSNFANLSTTEVQSLASKGGQAAANSENSHNFANLPKDELQAIASKGGHAAHGHHETSKGTIATNPGNFANRPTEEVKEVAAKGGAASKRGPAEDKQENLGERDKEWNPSYDDDPNE